MGPSLEILAKLNQRASVADGDYSVAVGCLVMPGKNSQNGRNVLVNL